MQWQQYWIDTRHRRDSPIVPYYGQEDFGVIQPTRWFHWAVAFTNSTTEGPVRDPSDDGLVDNYDHHFDFQLFLNGKHILRHDPSQRIAAYVFPGNYNVSWASCRPRPLTIGGEYFVVRDERGHPYSDYDDTNMKAQAATRNNFFGYMRFVRVWAMALDEDYIQSQYDWAFDVTDYEALLAYWLLDTPVPMDFVGRNACRPSPYASHATVDSEISPGANLEPIARYVYAMPPEVQKRGAGYEVELLAKIFATATKELVPMKPRMTALIKTMKTIYYDAKAGLKLRNKMWEIIRLFRNMRAGEVTANMHSIGSHLVSLFKMAYQEGFLKAIFKCFEISIFAVLRMLVRFVPYAGEAAIILDLAEAAYDIITAVQEYLRQTAEPDRPLGFTFVNPPKNDILTLISGGEGQKLKIQLNPMIPQGTTEYVLYVKCDQGPDDEAFIQYDRELRFSADGLEQTLKVAALRPSSAPVLLHFEPGLLPPLALNVVEHKIEILPPNPRLRIFEHPDEWRFEADFVVSYEGFLDAGAKFNFTPDDKGGSLQFEPGNFAFEAQNDQGGTKSNSILIGGPQIC